MKFKNIAICITASVSLAGCATNFAATPVPSSDQQIRYTQGIATTFSDKSQASLQVTPLGYIQGDNRLVFGAAAFNKATTAVNFGLENVTVTYGGSPLKIHTRDELAHEAKVKAAWAAVATVLAGAAAAYAANQNAYHTTSGYVSGPAGTTTFYARSYDPGLAYAGGAAAGAATGYGLVSIKSSLDDTIAHLNGSVLQINTVDPGKSAGGEIIVDMPKGKTFPDPLDIAISWNGEVHNFVFNIAKAAN